MSSLLLGAFKQSGMPFSQVLVLGGRLPYMASKVSLDPEGPGSLLSLA